MANIGKLKKKSHEYGDMFVGHIKTLTLDLEITLVPERDVSGTKRPSHRIFAKTSSGEDVEIGAAWARELTGPDQKGEMMYSLSIDDPSLENGLNVAAFPEKGTDEYVVTFRRRRAAG